MFKKDNNICLNLHIENSKYRVSVNRDSYQNYLDFGTAYHYHADYEIHFIMSGSCLFSCDNREYNCGENTLFILPPNTYHVTRTLEPGTKICFLCNVLENGGKPLFTITEERMYNSEMPESPVFNDILNDFSINPNKSNLLKLEAIFTIMLLNLRDKIVQNETDINSSCVIHTSIINDVLDYINNHCHEKIVLRDVAEAFYLSERQLTRIIKTETGNTFSELLTQYRISKAKKWIRKSDKTLEEIGHSVGFSTYCGFWKAFCGHEGISPSEYRQKVNE